MRKVRFAAVAWLTAGLSGCAAIEYYDIGRLSTEDEKYEIAWDTGRMDLQDVTLIVRPMNSRQVGSGLVTTFPLPPIPFGTDKDSDNVRAHEQSREAPFFVEVLFLETDKRIEFHPLDSIIIENGKRVPAVGYIGPTGLQSTRAIDRPFSPLCETAAQEPNTGPVVLEPRHKNCLILKFPMPSPSLSSGAYTIQLGKLQVADKNVDLPRIQVTPSRYHDIHN